MITSQAATVLAAFRHLTSIVSVMSPDRMPEVMSNMATAATQLDPHVIMQVMQSADEPGAVPVVAGMAAAFDDSKVAQLLATALALDGQASDRLATIFNTIAPDEDRKRRVLTLTRTMLSETDFGQSGQFQVLWASTEELLVSYNDKRVRVRDVSQLPRRRRRPRRTDGGGDLPPELPEWIESLGQANVRGLSVADADRPVLARAGSRSAPTRWRADMAALAEDLLMSGAYDDALTVTQRAADARQAAPKAIGKDASRQALDELGESMAMRESVALIGDVDEDNWTAMKAVIDSIGVSSVEALKSVILVEQDDADHGAGGDG